MNLTRTLLIILIIGACLLQDVKAKKDKKDKEDKKDKGKNQPTTPPTNTTWGGQQPPTPSPVDFPCIPDRYIPWTNLTLSVVGLVSKMYDDVMWDTPTTNETSAEQYSWFSLSDTQREAASGIGYAEETYDCWCNHYEDYFFSELESYGLDGYFGVLGWNEKNWDSADYVDTDLKDWVNLTDAEQAAADALCYTEGSWNELHLSQYPISPCDA